MTALQARLVLAAAVVGALTAGVVTVADYQSPQDVQNAVNARQVVGAAGVPGGAP